MGRDSQFAHTLIRGWPYMTSQLRAARVGL
jgi:hypothetical protein